MNHSNSFVFFFQRELMIIFKQYNFATIMKSSTKTEGEWLTSIGGYGRGAFLQPLNLPDFCSVFGHIMF